MDSVRIVIFNNQNPETFLVLAEADDPENFKLPGGKFEGDHEGPDQAAARELLEELGLSPVEVGLSAVAELVNEDGVSRRHIYTGRVDAPEVRPSAEIAEIRWVSRQAIPIGKNQRHMQAAVDAAAR